MKASETRANAWTSGEEAGTNRARPCPGCLSGTGTSPHLTDEVTEALRGEGIHPQYAVVDKQVGFGIRQTRD